MRNNDFDRQFVIMQRVIIVFFCIVAVIATTTIAFNMWVTYQVVSDPSIVGKIGGQVFNGFMETVGK